MQEGRVRRVQAALHGLQVVARLEGLGRPGVALGRAHPLQVGIRRPLVVRSHVRPHDAGLFDGRVSRRLDLGTKIRLGRLVGHVDAVARGVELPAVVHAAQAALFVAAEEQRGAAMRAVLGHQANLTVGVAEADQVLTQQTHAYAGLNRRSVASVASMAGSQYRRITLPIGVPAPTRVTSSFSSCFSIAPGPPRCKSACSIQDSGYLWPEPEATVASAACAARSAQVCRAWCRGRIARTCIRACGRASSTAACRRARRWSSGASRTRWASAAPRSAKL